MLLLSLLPGDSWFAVKFFNYMVALQNITLVSLNRIVNPILFPLVVIFTVSGKLQAASLIETSNSSSFNPMKLGSSKRF